MADKQWQGKTGGGRFGQYFLFAALKRIPVRVFYPVLYIVTPFYTIFGRKARRETVRYFRENHGWSKCRAIRGTFRNNLIFGKVVLDKFAMMANNVSQFNVEVENIELFNEMLAKPEGMILASAHIGNFELVGHCLKQDRKKVNGIIFGGESQQLKKHRNDSSEEANINLIPVSEDMSHLFAIKNALENGEIISILGDRSFGSAKSFRIPFLGRDAFFPIGMFKMAAQLDVPVLAIFVMKERGTRYRAHIFNLNTGKKYGNNGEKALKLATEYVSCLETVLHKYPAQWFNYYEFWKEN